MNMENIVTSFRDERSMEMYGKPESQLQLGEIQRLNEYIHDYLHPIWKPINDDIFGKYYLINNIGEVKSIRNNIIIAKKITKGYCRVHLSVNGVDKSMSIHRLVASAFIPNPENKPEVNHINGHKDFNWIGNLEWATYSENTKHAIEHHLMKSIGVENPNNRIDEKTVRKICELLELGKNPSEIDKILGCGKAIPTGIKSKQIWKSISCEYHIPDPVNKTKPLELKSKMLEMILNGYSDQEISDYIGLPRDNRVLGLGYVALFRRRTIKKLNDMFGDYKVQRSSR